MRDPVDQVRIVRGLERTTSAFQFWHSSWVGGEEVKYFRPLLSTLWWLEFKAFGGTKHAAPGFLAVHFLSHFGVCLLLAGFLRRLVGGWVALLSSALWAGSTLDLLTLPTPFWALQYWKDDPDIWVSGAVILALWALLSHLKTGKRSYLVAFFVAQLLAISIKEMAYVLPFLALALCWYENRLDRWPLVAGSFGVTGAAYAYRFWALDGTGFHFGTNGSWFERFALQAVGGRPLSLVISGQGAALCLALLSLAVCLALGRRRKLAAICGALGVAVAAVNDFQNGAGNFLLLLLTPFVSTFVSTGAALYSDGMVTAALLALWWHFVKGRDRRQVLAYAWVLLSYWPLMLAPITDHALYLPSIGWALWLAVAFERMASRAQAQLKLRF